MTGIPAGGGLVVIEEVGHVVHVEEPATVAALALEFLKGLA